MASSGYHSTVAKYLDRTRPTCSLPEHIQRGWHRKSHSPIDSALLQHTPLLGIYTGEENEYRARSSIIAPDGQIPNSTVRHRLGTTGMQRRTTAKTLEKVFDLPDDLYKSLSGEHPLVDVLNDEKLSFNWQDGDDEQGHKHQASPAGAIARKQRDDHRYEFDALERLSLKEIIEEIRSSIGKDLKSDEIKLITELMQILGRHKHDEVLNIYDEFVDMQLIDKFGGIPKLVQALQEIQKGLEQVAMKTNIASIETIIGLLMENDSTYRIATEMSTSFNETMKTHGYQQIIKLHNRLGA